MDNVFTLINKQAKHPLILTCEHASAKMPDEYQNLGLDIMDFDTHIARDKGAKEITAFLAQRLGCFAILGGYSRLLIDLNRRCNEEELIVKQSDGTLIGGNQFLSEAEKQSRIRRYYNPYYEAINEQVVYLEKEGIKPVVFSIHSYTPQLKGGAYRPWQAGVLYHKPSALADFLYQNLQMTGHKVVGENVPYDLRQYNTGAAVVCGEEKGFDYALIEIRDDEFDNLKQGTEEWGMMLAKLLTDYITLK